MVLGPIKIKLRYEKNRFSKRIFNETNNGNA